ncbi:unnamed protein product [Cylicocyclus nassatus]|uniref:Protein kinase domain-containing protein n=1 Tax=Cylicocyclus nassatus TaxID=53992 RepID=A0AA36M7K7_CYLNA|nr:unnamed protein product [Cylicocyclus nassatus]
MWGSDSEEDDGYNRRPVILNSRLVEGSEGTVVLDSTGRGGTEVGASDGSTSGKSPLGNHTDGNRWNTSTIRDPNAQASWNEVAIFFHKIDSDKNAVVQRGHHFGDVAIKFLNMNHFEEARRLDAFKSEVAAHKNTRNDNIVFLFLGYCPEAGKYGIVMRAARVIAIQICQGVSYLRQKKIIHKDLRSKNISIESKNKDVITNFGLFSMGRLRYPRR